jgi:hypothetical protein
MSTETTEKKVYPSQLNSKTISARIPVQDYVDFLQDSLSKGISLNDWLLMKIYNNSVGNIRNTNNENVIEITKDELANGENSVSGIIDFYTTEVVENCFEDDVIKADKKFIIDVLGVYHNCAKNLRTYINLANKKEASLSDVKLQLSILINNKFKDSKDKKDFKNDLFELLNELQ